MWLALVGVGGCQRPTASAEKVATRPPPKPFILHLPGIGGRLRIDRTMVAGLEQANPEAEIETYDWTANDPGLDALLAYERNRKQAVVISEMITQKFRADPRIKIYITSHSGGAGLLAWALEKCPDEVKVETVFFLAPALSPGYDLSKALKHVNRHAYVFYSEHDPVLDMTKYTGTIDRVKTDAAGLVGFAVPAKADSAQYAKLVQMPYSDDYAQYGNIGDHIGPMTTAFAQHVLAPLMGPESKSVQVVAPATQPAGVGS